MRIVHISDIHLSSSNLFDLRLIYIDSLIDALKIAHKNKPIDLIVITGDLVDKGGQSLLKINEYKNCKDPYEIFENEFLVPIKSELNFDNSKFIFIPGNHDVDVKKLDIKIENELQEIENNGRLDEFVSKYRSSVLKFNKYNHRIKKFKYFEHRFHKNTKGYEFSNYDSIYIYDDTIKNIKVGFALINDSWRCSTSETQNKNGLYFGTRQLHFALKTIKNHKTHCNIILTHHPKESYHNPNEFKNILASNDFHIHLFGDGHHSVYDWHVNAKGKCFGIMARTGFYKINETENEWQSGFQIIDIDFEKAIIDKIHFYKYQKNLYHIDFDTDSSYGGIDEQKHPLTFQPLKTTILFKKQNLNKDLFFKYLDNGFSNYIEKYELRYIDVSNNIGKNNHTSFFYEKENRITLLDYISENNKIVLLGGPGVGKSVELHHIFYMIWENIDKKQLIPIFLNIKNFRDNSTIEELIKIEDWKKFPSLIFIFDGLDEIPKIPDFITALENFIIKYDYLNIKYLISCRTNIYEKYVNNISDFKTAYLRYLSEEQIKSILKSKYGINISESDFKKLELILQTPFNLELFGKYYIENGSFPTTIKDSMELSISSEIKKSIRLLKRRYNYLSEYILYSSLKKVAISAELIQKNFLLESDLHHILQKDEKVANFEELPFIEAVESRSYYKFRHKIYQEYFAAGYLSELENEDIIKYIQIAESINKIRSSLFNTTTYLLNILEDEKFEYLKNWLLENEIEVLFYADDNRLPINVKNEIFESYYKEICINKTFWLGQNDKIKLETLAEYANFNFLVDELKNDERIDRCRISIIEVLSLKKLSLKEKEITKQLFIALIEKLNKVEKFYFVSQILRGIKNLEFYKDEVLWNKILNTVKESKDKGITHELISIYSKIDDSERNNKEFLEIISYHFRLEDDNTVRGTEYIVENIIIDTKDWDFFFELIKLLFEDNNTFKMSNHYFDNFKQQLNEKILELTINKEYKTKFLEFSFSDEIRTFSKDDFLSTIINQIGVDSDIMIKLLKSDVTQKNSLYSLARYFTEESINAIIEAYRNGNITFNNSSYIQSIRNWMWHENRNLARLWQDKFIEIGYEFSDLLETEEMLKTFQEKFEKFKEKNNQIIFEKEVLIDEIKKFFTENNIERINKSEVQQLNWKWYKKTGYHGLINTVHSVIEKSFRFNSNNYQTVESITKILDDDYFYLSTIKSLIGQNIKKDLSSKELELIKELTNKIEKNIDFDDVYRFNDDDSFTITIHYDYIKTLLFFENRFRINRSDNFYLNCIQYGDLKEMDYYSDNDFIKYVKTKLDSSKHNELNKTVIKNIKEKKLLYRTQKNHYKYALDNNLEDSYDIIEENILKKDFLKYDNSFLELFLSKTNYNLNFLKACCEDMNSHLCWQAIKYIIVKYDEKEFCTKIAREYLKSDKKEYIDEAVNVLFYFNEEDSLQQYLIVLKRMIIIKDEDTTGFNPSNIYKYTRLNEVHLIEELFNIVFEDTSQRTFYLHNSKEFLRNLIGQLASNDSGYETIKPILENIKSNKTNNENQYFYINHLIELMENAHLNKKSKTYSISELKIIIK